MFSDFFMQDMTQPAIPKEGDLYKEVTVSGRNFRLLYGYYEDFERESRHNEPIPIYPDFIKKPVFTDEGVPLITAMQNVCRQYSGKPEGDSCSDCIHFRKSEELFGLCTCPENRQSVPERTVAANE